ncbi:MAG: alcohol dehydrogenase catalytic domain-containing protein [Vicinamibacterales bacterium]
MCSCGNDHDDVVSGRHIYAGGSDSLTVSRREMLKHGVTAAAATAAILSGRAAAAQAPPAGQAVGAPQGGVPGAGGNARGGPIFWGNTGAGIDPQSILAERQGPTRTTGLKFQALVRYGTNLTTETLTLLPLHPLHVVVRMQVCQTCYSTTGQMTGNAPNALVTGHGGVGIVEEVGRLVKRVKVGDQVILATTPNCGVCQNCLSGRGDLCNTRLPAIPNATMSDNTPVYMDAPPVGPAGYSEFIVLDEDWCVPVFTRVPPAELALLSCVAGTGLGLAMCRFPIEAGSDVVVFGLGPIGASAVQGARIQGAKTIIGIDPIRYRRDLALKVGATHVLDSNELRGNDLLNRIRALTPDVVPAGRRYAGERQPGPLYALEAVGGTRFPLPSGVEAPADMTGIEPLQQAWTVVRNGGYVRTCSIGHPAGANVTFPGGQWANAGKTHVPGNYAGVEALRDLPRFVRLVEKGLFDATSLVGQTFRSDKMKEALQVAADRSAITSMIEFT